MSPTAKKAEPAPTGASTAPAGAPATPKQAAAPPSQAEPPTSAPPAKTPDKAATAPAKPALAIPRNETERLTRMKQQFAGLRLGPAAEDWFEVRFLSQLEWYEDQAPRQYYFYVIARLTAIVGGIMTPALFAGPDVSIGRITSHGIAFVVGLAVAAAVAIDSFLRFGEHWRHFRTIAELLKIEFSSLVAKAPPYDRQPPARAYTEFVERCERIFRDDIRRYMATVAPSTPTDGGRETTT
jgi:phage terminase large subunit-like protein